ncbi:MAG: hypothetical protein IT330_01025 [Anaerolineae bacterium]|nr:hypothetical protein [Anaerolineae bacterium]
MAETSSGQKATIARWFCLFGLLVVALAAVACAPKRSGQALTTPTVIPLPATVPPAPAISTQATLPPSQQPAPIRESPEAYSTRYAAHETEMVIRATTSPFPTPAPVTVQVGPPAFALVRRDDLSLHVQLPKNTYLAGEGGRGEVTLRNDSPETIYFYCQHYECFRLVVLDERGHQPAPWPFLSSMRFGFGRPAELAPGQTYTQTLTFQIPPEEQVAGHAYVLWAEAEVSREAGRFDRLLLRLEAGPIPLRVVPPDAQQRLQIELQANGTGWRVRATDANGQVPSGPLWGMLDAASSHGSSSGLLRDSADGTWSFSWDMGEAGLNVRVWVAAPGYVTAAANYIAPGPTPEPEGGTIVSEPAVSQDFPSLAAAEAAFQLRIHRPGRLPDGAVLDTVHVNISPEQRHCETTGLSGNSMRCSPIVPQCANVLQVYRLPGEAWLELSQMSPEERCPPPGEYYASQ